MRNFGTITVMIWVMLAPMALAQGTEANPGGTAITAVPTGDTPAQDGDTAQTEPAPAPATAARDFKACEVPEDKKRRWGTSADLLQQTARCVYAANLARPGEGKRLTLIEDIYTKAWS